MDRAGVSQTVTMALSGHKTASVYQRYPIVADDDLRHALTRMQAELAARTERPVVRLTAGRAVTR